jgi:hypothetical protein
MSRVSTLFLLTALLCCGCASGSGTKTQAVQDGNVVTTYDDPAFGIRLTYPGDWQEQSIPFMIRPKGTIVVLVAPSDVSGMRMPPTVSFVAQDANANQTETVDQQLDAMQQQLIEKGQSQIGNFQLNESTRDTLGGEPARRVTYTGNKLNVALKVMNVIALHGGRQYGVAYSADPEIFDQHRPAVQRVIGSVQWMKK